MNNFVNTNYSKICVGNWYNFMHQSCHIHRNIIILIVAIIFLIFTSASIAKDLGNYGQTYKIKEEDPIEYIKNRLRALEATGKLANYNQAILEKTKESLGHPKPVVNIIHTKDERVFFYDPTYIVEEDIKDHLGQIIYKEGYIFNPLDKVSFGAPLIFIDGDDEAQIKFAFGDYFQNAFPKIILVKGSPLKIEKDTGKKIYFDQHGVLTQKLGIKQVPAIVTQDGSKVKISEIILS